MSNTDTEFNLWKLLELVARRIKFILVFVLGITAVSVIVSLLLPRWYQATALILPPKEESAKLGWAGTLEEMISLTSGLPLPIMATPTDIYARILGSRTLAERVIDENDLREYYDTYSMEDLVEKIKKRARFRVTPEGLLEISYMDKSAEKAAELANSFVEELDEMNREIVTTRARLTREFIEKRLSEVSDELDSARGELQQFQDQYKAVDLDRQTQLAIESAVGLKVDLATNEIEINVKEKTLSPTHPDVVNLKRRVEEIKKQINSLEFGGSISSYLNLPISEVPSLKIKYAELTSRLKVSETLYKILSEQYEQAKIHEKMNTPTISIIDRAYPPELAVKPQKRIIVIVTFAISLILAVFIALLLDYLENLKKTSPEDYERARFFYMTVLGWIPGIKRASRANK
jgi:tyrosine-protein kinase Etk/Wzc